MKQALTKRQSDIYNYIKKQIVTEKMPPTINDICRNFGFASTNAASQTLKALEKKGYIERSSIGASRGIKILESDSQIEMADNKSELFKTITIIGKGTADNPISVFLSNRGQINIDSKYFVSDKLLFAAYVEDAGMARDGIFENDIVIAIHDENVESGMVAVVLVKDTIFVRKYNILEDEIELESNAKGFTKMTFQKGDANYKVLGKVIGVIRKLE